MRLHDTKFAMSSAIVEISIFGDENNPSRHLQKDGSYNQSARDPRNNKNNQIMDPVNKNLQLGHGQIMEICGMSTRDVFGMFLCVVVRCFDFRLS
jgi:hypothetical protein